MCVHISISSLCMTVYDCMCNPLTRLRQGQLPRPHQPALAQEHEEGVRLHILCVCVCVCEGESKSTCYAFKRLHE